MSEIHNVESENPDSVKQQEAKSESDERESRVDNIEDSLDSDSKSETKDIKSPSEVARENQHDSDYNEDNWHDTTVESGTKLYQLSPGDDSDYYTTEDEVEKAGYNAENVNNGLQIAPYKDNEMRSEMKIYEVKEDIPAAESICEANNGYGEGGMKQYYIPNSKEEENLEEVGTVQLDKGGDNDD